MLRHCNSMRRSLHSLRSSSGHSYQFTHLIRAVLGNPGFARLPSFQSLPQHSVSGEELPQVHQNQSYIQNDSLPKFHLSGSPNMYLENERRILSSEEKEVPSIWHTSSTDTMYDRAALTAAGLASSSFSL